MVEINVLCKLILPNLNVVINLYLYHNSLLNASFKRMNNFVLMNLILAIQFYGILYVLPINRLVHLHQSNLFYFLSGMS